MKSKFGFIPIVLPVLVMVLIIGLINIGSAPWVQAHEDAAEHMHSMEDIANHPHLSALTLTERHRQDDGTFTNGDSALSLVPGFNLSVLNYTVSAPYDVDYIQLDPTHENSDPGNPLVVTVNGVTRPSDTTTMVRLGRNVISVKVNANDNSRGRSPFTEYVIVLTKELPQADQIVLSSEVSAEGEDTTPITDDVLEGTASLMGNDASLRAGDRGVDVRVKYHVAEIDLELTIPVGLAGVATDDADDAVRVVHGNIPEFETSTKLDGGIVWQSKGIKLRVGENPLNFTVVDKKSSRHTAYSVTVKREVPQLSSNGVNVTIGTGNPMPVPMGQDTTTGKYDVGYQDGEVSVSAMGSGGSVIAKYSVAGKDTDDVQTGAYTMVLEKGENDLTIVAHDPGNPGYETEYTLTVNRAGTPLGNLQLQSTSTNNPGAPLKGENLYFNEAQTATSSQTLDRLNVDSISNRGFDASTTTYWASVSYDVEWVTVIVDEPAGAPEAYQIDIESNGPDTTTATSTDQQTDLTHRVRLNKGPNTIKVTARIPAVGDAPGNSNEYTIHVERKDPNNRPSELKVIEFNTTDGRMSRREVRFDYDGDPASNTTTYDIAVRSNVSSIGIAADHGDENARIFVNDNVIPKNASLPLDDYKEVILSGDNTVVEITVRLDNQPPGVITLNVARGSGTLYFEGDIHPLFEGRRIKLEDSLELESAIVLPEAVSVDGGVSYDIAVTDDRGQVVELRDLGLEFDATSRKITGTPVLAEAQGYESEFEVVLTAIDSIGREVPYDFVLIITHDEGDSWTSDEQIGDPLNTLQSLTVETKSVTPKFEPTSGGPYGATVPANSTEADVEFRRTDSRAVVSLNGVVHAGNMFTTRRFDEELMIKVTHPDLDDAMYYRLTIALDDDDSAGFMLPGVGHKVYQAGKAIEELMLPSAEGGVAPYVYTLKDHDDIELDATVAGNPGELVFDADPKKRMLTGVPMLFEDAYRTVYRMTYAVEDNHGAIREIRFRVTICDPAHARVDPADCISSNSDVGLDSLELSDLTLMPEFDADTMMYTADAAYETMYTTVTPMAIDDEHRPFEYMVNGEMVADADTATDAYDVALAAGTTTVITVKAVKEYGVMNDKNELFMSDPYTVNVTRAGQPANPGFTPMGLEVMRDGSDATITWTPGADATKQFVAALILNPTTGTMLDTLRGGMDIDADVSTYTFENLADASVGSYIYGVWGYDDMDNWKDAEGNAYLMFTTDQ